LFIASIHFANQLDGCGKAQVVMQELLAINPLGCQAFALKTLAVEITRKISKADDNGG